MPPYPLKSNGNSPNMRHSYSNSNGFNAEDSTEIPIPSVAIVASGPTACLTHIQTQDPLIQKDDDATCNDTDPSALHEPTLSTCQRVTYGLAAPPSQMCFNILGFFMTIYLLETAKIPPKYILIIAFAGRFWDAVSDPVVGYLVSKTKTRFGQCRIWIAAATPFSALSFFLFFHTPSWTSTEWRFAYYFVLYFAFCTFMTTYHIPYTSMTMLISDRPVDRDAATTFRMVFEMVGTLFGVLSFTFITQHTDRCSSVNNSTLVAAVMPEEEGNYRIGAALISSIVILCGLVGFFGTKEVVSNDANFMAAGQDSVIKSFSRCLSHRSYLLLMIAFMLSSLAVQIVQSTLVLYTIYSLRMKSHLKYAVTIVMSVAIFATPLIFYLIRKLGKKIVYGIGMILIIPVCLSATLCPSGGQYVPVYYATVTFAGLFVCINLLLPWIMLPDVIDDYTVSSGRRDQATFYSLYVFFNKFAVGISAALLQLALHIAGYRQPPACTQPQAVANVLRIIIGPVPIVIIVLALIVLYFYPITPKYRQNLNDILLTRRLNDNGKIAIQMGSNASSSSASSDGDSPQCHLSQQIFTSGDRIVIA